jgi:hypothetical protein
LCHNCTPSTIVTSQAQRTTFAYAKLHPWQEQWLTVFVDEGVWLRYYDVVMKTSIHTCYTFTYHVMHSLRHEGHFSVCQSVFGPDRLRTQPIRLPRHIPSQWIYGCRRGFASSFQRRWIYCWNHVAYTVNDVECHHDGGAAASDSNGHVFRSRFVDSLHWHMILWFSSAHPDKYWEYIISRYYQPIISHHYQRIILRHYQHTISRHYQRIITSLSAYHITSLSAYHVTISVSYNVTIKISYHVTINVLYHYQRITTSIPYHATISVPYHASISVPFTPLSAYHITPLSEHHITSLPIFSTPISILYISLYQQTISGRGGQLDGLREMHIAGQGSAMHK